MMGTILETADYHPYLGVELSSDLEWKQHIQQVTGKAQRTLTFLQRNLYRYPQSVKQRAYISLVRPILEYAATVWDPHHKKEIDGLEKFKEKQSDSSQETTAEELASLHLDQMLSTNSSAETEGSQTVHVTYDQQPRRFHWCSKPLYTMYYTKHADEE